MGLGSGLRACKKKRNNSEATRNRSTQELCMVTPEQAVTHRAQGWQPLAAMPSQKHTQQA